MAFANRYAGTCTTCGHKVARGEGIIVKQDGKWLTYHAKDQCPKEEKVVSFSHIRPDEYQQAILEAIRKGAKGENILIDAKAGTGKTSIECMGLSQLYEEFPSLRIICLAFGNEDGSRMRDNLVAGVEGRTTHSFAMEIVRDTLPKVKLNKKKSPELLEAVVGPDEDKAPLRNWVGELLAKVQADAILMDDFAGMAEVIKSYDLDIPEDVRDKVMDLTNKMLENGADFKKYGYSFDDALYFIATNRVQIPQYDIIGVDEIQDFNECQLILLRKLMESGARIVAVGDPNQSLYAFRGARHDAFDRARETLSESSRGLIELPMPVSRRSAKKIITLAQKYVPEIKARDDAPLGDVKTGVHVPEMMEQLRPGHDMVICRTNAALIKLKYICIKRGIPAYMRGGMQEAAMLCWFVDLFATKCGVPTDDISTMMDRAQDWLKERTGKTNAYRMAEHKARLEAIEIISGHVLSVKDLKAEIRKLFAPPKANEEQVVISTIHRAKGSEATRVYHLSPELVPHPKAKTKEQLQQEFNAAYVGITRAKEAYYETIGDLSEVA